MAFFTYQGLPRYEWYYPAPAIFFLYPFYKLDAGFHIRSIPELAFGFTDLRGYHVYLVLTVALALALAVGVARAIYREGLTATRAAIFSCGTLLTAWPLFFALQRGNIEALTWMLIAAAVWAFVSGQELLAAILIGIAGSVKLYPLLFIGLFIPKRNIRAVAVCLAAFAAVTVAGLWFLDPNIAQSLHYVLQGVQDWTRDTSQIFQPFFDHSAFDLVKQWTNHEKHDFHHELHIYYIAAGLAAIVLFWRVLRQPAVNQVLFLSCAAVTLPPASFDYTLCLLYVPLAWLAVLAVRGSGNRASEATLNLVFVLLAVVLAPELFLISAHTLGDQVILKPVCLITLMVLSALLPLAANPAEDAVRAPIA